MKGLIKIVRKILRAKRLSELSRAKYDAIVYSCSNVSRINNELSFIIHKTGAFGSPKIESIARPDTVIIDETADFVVIKDGKIYELKSW